VREERGELDRALSKVTNYFVSNLYLFPISHALRCVFQNPRDSSGFGANPKRNNKVECRYS
jgi:hypothetical protein